MTDEEKKRLSTFEARLRHLIFLHDELRRENAELKQLLKTKQEECEQVHAEYEALEDDYTNLKTAMTISLNGSDVKEIQSFLAAQSGPSSGHCCLHSDGAHAPR